MPCPYTELRNRPRIYDGRLSRPYEFDAVGPAVPAETLFTRWRRRS